MKLNTLILLLILASCSINEPIKTFTNESYGTTDEIHISIKSEKPGIRIIIAPTEEQTYIITEEDCIRIVYTSGYDKVFTIKRRYDPEYVRVEISGETVDLFQL